MEGEIWFLKQGVIVSCGRGCYLWKVYSPSIEKLEMIFFEGRRGKVVVVIMEGMDWPSELRIYEGGAILGG